MKQKKQLKIHPMAMTFKVLVAQGDVQIISYLVFGLYVQSRLRPELSGGGPLSPESTEANTAVRWSEKFVLVPYHHFASAIGPPSGPSMLAYAPEKSNLVTSALTTWPSCIKKTTF